MTQERDDRDDRPLKISFPKLKMAQRGAEFVLKSLCASVCKCMEM